MSIHYGTQREYMLSKAAEELTAPVWQVAGAFVLAPLKVNIRAEANASAVLIRRAAACTAMCALFNIYIVGASNLTFFSHDENISIER
jgi:hypothetical protein